METTYPQFYRKDGKCVKVLNAMQARVIVLPPESLVPERMTTTFPSPERMSEFLQGMEECTPDKFREFNVTFYLDLEDEIREFRLKQL